MNMTLLWQGKYQGGIFRAKETKEKMMEAERRRREEEGARRCAHFLLDSLAEEGKRATLSESRLFVDAR